MASAVTALTVNSRTEESIQNAIRSLYQAGGPAGQAIKNFLNGTWLGEPVHAAVTDIPVGAWTCAVVFDALGWVSGRRELSVAADASILVGLAGAAISAVTGATDWQDTDPPARSLGLTHAFLNIGATALFSSSVIFRKSRRRTLGRIAAMVGYGVVMLSAHLGGKLVYEEQIGVDHTKGEKLPDEFTPVISESELPEARAIRVDYNGSPILLVRRGDQIFALAETCSHLGGPLAEGKLQGNSIVCPWHGSRFCLKSGRVLDGPAVHPQPALDTRINDGKVEVRARG